MTGTAAVTVLPSDLRLAAADLEQAAGAVGLVVPRLLAALAESGLALLPAAGLVDALPTAARVAAHCAPTPGGLPAEAARLAELAAALLVAASAYAAVDDTLAMLAAADAAALQVEGPLRAVAMVVLWDVAAHTPYGWQRRERQLLELLDRATEGRSTATPLGTGGWTAEGVVPWLGAEAAASPESALAAVAALEAASSGSVFSVTETSEGPPPRFVVCLPGLHDGARTDASAADLTGAIATLTGHSSYVTAVAGRLAQLPVGSEVVLVGHSQGGMVAQAVAADELVARAGIHVRAVLTAGSPRLAVAPAALSATTTLALESAGDPVPRLRELAAGILLPPVPQPPDPGYRLVRFAATHPGWTLLNHNLVDGGYLAAAAAPGPAGEPFSRASAAFWTPAPVDTELWRVTDGAGALP